MSRAVEPAVERGAGRLSGAVRALAEWVLRCGRARPHVRDGLVLLCALAVVYHQAFDVRTVTPEFGTFYLWNHNLGFWDVVRRYGGLGQGWYRPTAFYAYFWLAKQFFGWHDFHAYKALTLGMLWGGGFMLRAVVLALMPGARMLATCAAIAAITHPVYYVIVYQLAGFDLLYQLFILAAVVLFVRAALGRPGALVAATLVPVTYVLALTSKELAITLPLALAGLAIVLKRPGSFGDVIRQPTRVWGVGLGLAVVLAGYYVLHMAQMPKRTGAYRNTFDWGLMLTQLERMPRWVSHLFADKQSFIGVHETPLDTTYGGLFALLLLASLLAASARLNGDVALRQAARSLWVLLGAFMLVPIYAGSEPWHVVVPVLMAGGLVCVGATFAARKTVSHQPARARWAAVVVAAAAVLVGSHSFPRELHGGRPLESTINVGAALRPPVHPKAIEKGTPIAFETKGRGSWIFGGGFQLWRYAYQDPSIQELPIASLDACADEGQLRAWHGHPGARYFALKETEAPAWRDETERFRAYVARCLGLASADQ